MEFNEKLQVLRKQHDLTQEQLAEQLYVSRTAISKWESGKGYPNIESLKAISAFFSVTIDELLSGDELITLAESENRSNIGQVNRLVFGILDLLLLSFIFLPLYGQQDGDFIRSVTLLEYHESGIIRAVYFVWIIMMSVLGIVQLLLLRSEDHDKKTRAGKTGSMGLHAVGILGFIASRQPYIAAFVFLLFIVKVVLLIKDGKGR